MSTVISHNGLPWSNPSLLRLAADLLKEYQLLHPDTQKDQEIQESSTHKFIGLANWLDTEALQAEFDALERDFELAKQDPMFYKNVGKIFQDWTKNFMALNVVQNDCTGYLQCSPVDDRGLNNGAEASIAIQSGSIGMAIRRTLGAAQSLPYLQWDMLVADIIESSMRWQKCRTYLILTDFLQDGVEKIVNVLVHAHRYLDPPTSPSHPKFAEHYGNIATLTCKIHDFLFAYHQNYRDTTSTAFNDFIDLPWDLYGIRLDDSKSKSSTPPHIRVFWTTSFANGPAPLYKAVHQMLKKLLIDQLVLPYIDAPPTSKTQKKKKKADVYQERMELLASCQLRGVLLQCLIEEFQDESICATSGVDLILKSPIRVFPGIASSPSRLLAQIRAKPWEFLTPLRRWIRKSCSSEIGEIAGAISRFVNHRMIEFHVGHAVSMTVPEITGASDETPLTEYIHRRRPLFDHISLTADVLTTSRVTLGIAGLIIREALNERRGLAPGIGPLRHFLDGRHPGNGRLSLSADRDHFDPIRRFNRGAELMAYYLPGHKLTTSVGLSNLLAWMGTGQGNKTSSFLSHVGNIFAMTLANCIGVFNRGLKVNEGILAAHSYDQTFRADLETPPAHIPNLVQISNSRIYGSACNTLKLSPTIRQQRALPSVNDSNRLDLVEKFGPYWTNEVETAWIKFMGNLLNQDPSTYSGQRNSWSSGIQMLKSLKISGFMSGLTVMQTCNALAFSNIISPPTLFELAEWIWQHQHLGAFAGLIFLGFKLPSQKAVFIALTSIFNHLDVNLTTADKRVLGFDTIFLEHLLCKVSRWTKRLTELKKWADEAEKSDNFVASANEFNCQAFPFPLLFAEGHFEEIMKGIDVSGSIFY